MPINGEWMESCCDASETTEMIEYTLSSSEVKTASMSGVIRLTHSFFASFKLSSDESHRKRRIFHTQPYCNKSNCLLLNALKRRETLVLSN